MSSSPTASAAAAASSSLNIGIVYACLALFLLVGIWAGRRRNIGILLTVDEFVSARSSSPSWMSLGTNFLVAGLGVWTFITLPETGASLGIIGIAAYSLAAAIPLLALSFIGPAVRSQCPNGVTITFFVRERFGFAAQSLTAILSLIYMSVCLVSELTAFGVIMDLFNVPALPAQITVCLCTTIYTVVSGMQASILTDTLQGAVMILLIILATISFGLNIHLDPLIIQNSPLLTPTSAGIESLYTLIVAVFAANIFHQGYWQRVYVARSDQHLFKACIFSFATTLVVMFLIGFTGVAAVWSGVVHVNDNMAFFKLIQTLPPWTNHLLLLLATCFISSSVDTLQNGIVASIVHDVFRDAISLNKARIVAALINIPALLIATLKLDVFSLYLMADLFASMIFGPLLLGLVTKFDLHRKLNGADFCIGVLGGLLSVVAVGTLVHGGNVYKGIELLRLPNGVTGSSNDQSINDSLYAFIAAPFGSVVIMFCSYITRSRCQEQQSQQQPLASPTTSFNRIRSPSLFKGSEPVAEIIFVA